MRVALFNFSSSGLFHYSASLAIHLAQNDSVEQVLFITSRANNLVLIPVHPKLQVLALPFEHTLFSLLRWLTNPIQQWRLQQTLRRFKPDVVHITDVIPVHLFYYFLLRRYPKVVTVHDPLPHTGDRGQISTRFLLRYFVATAQRFIVHSHSLKKAFMQRWQTAAENVSVIPMGAWPLLQTARHSTAQSIPNSVLFFGRIVAYKGVDLLLDALIKLQNEGEPVRLILAGSGPLTPYEEKLAKLNDPIVMNRYIHEDEAAAFFQQATLVALSYREATQSAVATMAMAASKPILATRVGALPELLADNETALVVEPTVEELAAGIRVLLRDKTLQHRLSGNALRAAQTTYSWKTVATRHVTLYQELCR